MTSTPSRARAPVWHWIICILYILIGVFGVIWFLALFSGSVEVDAKKEEFLASLSPVRIVGTLGVCVLYTIAGTLLLFRLRAGLVTFAAAFLFRVIDELLLHGFGAFTPGYLGPNVAKVVGGVIGVAIAWLVPLTLIFIWANWWHIKKLR